MPLYNRHSYGLKRWTRRNHLCRCFTNRCRLSSGSLTSYSVAARRTRNQSQRTHHFQNLLCYFSHLGRSSGRFHRRYSRPRCNLCLRRLYGRWSILASRTRRYRPGSSLGGYGYNWWKNYHTGHTGLVLGLASRHRFSAYAGFWSTCSRRCRTSSCTFSRRWPSASRHTSCRARSHNNSTSGRLYRSAAGRCSRRARWSWSTTSCRSSYSKNLFRCTSGRRSFHIKSRAKRRRRFSSASAYRTKRSIWNWSRKVTLLRHYRYR